MIQEIKRLKPFLTFEVITEDGKMLHIQAQSYEASGQYITFYQAISSHETVNKEQINQNTGEVFLGQENIIVKKKMPFLTLKNVKKITIINLPDEFNLVEEIGEIYEPQTKIEVKEEQQQQQQQQHYTQNIQQADEQNNLPKMNVKPFIRDGIKNSSDHDNRNDDIKYQDELNQPIDTNDTATVNNDYEHHDNNYHSEFETDIPDMEIVNNQDHFPNDDIDPFLSLSEGEQDNLLIHDDFLPENELSENTSEPLTQTLDDDIIADLLNNQLAENSDVKQEQVDNITIEDNQDEVTQSKQKILSMIEKKRDFNNSEDQKEEEQEKHKIIKTELQEYLKRTSTHFRSEPFYKFIMERVSHNSITHDDVVIQICNMIKNREIDYQRFYNDGIQQIIAKNKDVLQHRYNGDIHNLYRILQCRNEETRCITIIDLVVYLRKHNYFR